MFRITQLLIATLLASIPLPLSGQTDDGPHLFRTHVAPILERRCVSCHNDQARKGDLSLQSAGKAQEYFSAEPGNAAHLVDLVTPVSGSAEMPLDSQPLSAEELAVIQDWVGKGVPWPAEVQLSLARPVDLDWWSLRPLKQPPVPKIEDPWIRTPIDAFILAQLCQRNLAPSATASRAELIRRLYFDLLGLPPTPEEVETFVASTDPRAYDHLVDRLLDSKHYGERWARHWLDVVHYADTHGYDKDKLRPNAWPYRDYVIRSLNADKPYARFVLEQIAGDALWPGTRDGVTATGFIAAGPWDFIGHAEVPETKIDGRIARNLDRDDMVASTLNTFCSTTVQCARCHDHKFDPVSQEHYYSLQAVFAALDRADRGYDDDPLVATKRAELRSTMERLEQQGAQLKKLAEQPVADELSAIDALLETLDAKAEPERVKQIEERRRAVVDGGLTADLRARRREHERRLKLATASLKDLPVEKMVYAGTIHHGRAPFAGTGPNGGKPRPIHLLHRGDVLNPGAEVGPGTIPVIADSDWRFDLPPNHHERDRRVALARWLVRDDNPLTWRSIVNRVWQYHFGRGLVDSPNDFGRMGQSPSHPALLDWLAIRFRDDGQSLKSLHRLIVTSSVYRQSSRHDAKHSQLDSGNVFLWRMNRRRLTAEEIRDSVLAVSGKLNRKMFGPGMQLFVLERPEHSPHYEYQKHDPNDPASHRRSIYRFIVRSQPDPFMATLDCADSSQSVAKRDETVTALQALSLLNNKFILRMAECFAERLRNESPDAREQLRRGFRLATGREPTAEQLVELARFNNAVGLENTCRMLFNLNEFVFID